MINKLAQRRVYIVSVTRHNSHEAFNLEVRNYNIDINDPANGIVVGHPRPHNEIHNRKFHEKVRDRLKNVRLKEVAG